MEWITYFLQGLQAWIWPAARGPAVVCGRGRSSAPWSTCGAGDPVRREDGNQGCESQSELYGYDILILLCSKTGCQDVPVLYWTVQSDHYTKSERFVKIECIYIVVKNIVVVPFFYFSLHHTLLFLIELNRNTVQIYTNTTNWLGRRIIFLNYSEKYQFSDWWIQMFNLFYWGISHPNYQCLEEKRIHDKCGMFKSSSS